MLYRVLRALLRHALRVFFRRIEIEGLESVPTEGPLLLAANHPNTLIDVLLVAVMLDRQVGCIAKATLFDNPLAGWLLRSLGAVPIHRAQDGRGGKDQNQRALEASEVAVASGQAILIFPEGVSQDAPRLQPLKTGLARIALGAERRAPGQVCVVPVALVYDDHETFRSRARVTYLPPIQVAPFLGLEAESGDAFAPARALTEAIAESLRQDVVHVEDESLDPLVGLVDELYAPHAVERAGGRLAVTPVIARAVNHFAEREPERLAKVRADLEAYQAALAAAGVSDDAVRTREREVRLQDTLLYWLFALPALWGALNHLLLYNAPRAALRLIPIHPLYNASAKLLVGLLALGACYGVQGFGVYWLASHPLREQLLAQGLFTPWTLTLLYVSTLPLCGMIALLWLEGHESRVSRSRAHAQRSSLGPELLAALRQQRSDLLGQLDLAQADFLAATDPESAERAEGSAAGGSNPPGASGSE